MWGKYFPCSCKCFLAIILFLYMPESSSIWRDTHGALWATIKAIDNHASFSPFCFLYKQQRPFYSIFSCSSTGGSRRWTPLIPAGKHKLFTWPLSLVIPLMKETWPRRSSSPPWRKTGEILGKKVALHKLQAVRKHVTVVCGCFCTHSIRDLCVCVCVFAISCEQSLETSEQNETAIISW